MVASGEWLRRILPPAALIIGLAGTAATRAEEGTAQPLWSPIAKPTPSASIPADLPSEQNWNNVLEGTQVYQQTGPGRWVGVNPAAVDHSAPGVDAAGRSGLGEYGRR
jgi:hypothetical protein